MWIVRVALDRPYTSSCSPCSFWWLSPIMILRSRTDIFPQH